MACDETERQHHHHHHHHHHEHHEHGHNDSIVTDSVFDDTVQLRTVITLYVNAKFDLGQKNLPGRIYPMFSDDDMKQLAVDVSGGFPSSNPDDLVSIPPIDIMVKKQECYRRCYHNAKQGLPGYDVIVDYTDEDVTIGVASVGNIAENVGSMILRHYKDSGKNIRLVKETMPP